MDIAYLADRVLCGAGKKQKYGTQVTLKEGEFTPKPIEDEEHVDERRKELGLEPLADYLKMIARVYGISKNSESIRCFVRSSTSTWRNLPRPTCKVTGRRLIPFFSIFLNSSFEK